MIKTEFEPLEMLSAVEPAFKESPQSQSNFDIISLQLEDIPNLDYYHDVELSDIGEN